MNFPSADAFRGVEVQVKTRSYETQYIIQSITRSHRCTIGFVTVLRFCMVSTLIWVGVSFLMRDTDWVNLLLNGVALVFVTEVANHVFAQVLDPLLQEEFLAAEPMYVEAHGNK